MALYTLTKQQKQALKTRNALQKAKDQKLPEVITQEEAHRRWPDREYNEFDPFIMICGTRKAIEKNCKIISQMKVRTLQGDMAFDLDSSKGDWEIANSDKVTSETVEGYSVDVDRLDDTRIVIWK